MACQLLIDRASEVVRTAMLEDGRLVEYYQEEEHCESLVGQVLLGRVERVLPDLKAAFVKIGQPLNGFLPLQEADSFHKNCGRESLMSGQTVIVQVKKDPKGGKGAFLTRDIALPGQYVLLMPCNRFVGLSKRIEDPADRQRAQQLGQHLAGDQFGLIVRHAALFAPAEDVEEEVSKLWKLWQEISEKAPYVKAPACLYQEPDMAHILKRDYSARCKLDVCDSADEVSRLWNAHGVDRQLASALKRRVELPDGGSLVIDEREALQTIDINSGRNVKAAGEQSLALEENLRAVAEIARQIRLRRLSGIILIDFIDMDTDAERERVLRAMEQETSFDRVKTVIHGFTRLGLLEMTRKRTADSLRDALTKPCAACHETGRISL